MADKVGEVLAEPVGREAFEGADQLGHGDLRWEVQERVDLVGFPIDPTPRRASSQGVASTRTAFSSDHHNTGGLMIAACARCEKVKEVSPVINHSASGAGAQIPLCGACAPKQDPLSASTARRGERTANEEVPTWSATTSRKAR